MSIVKKKDTKVNLKKVDKSDFKFLYELLAQRNPKTNISHSHMKMPTYEQHVKFAKSRPYSKWCIIKFQNKKVGSISLTKKNEIGIFLIRNVIGKGIGTEALKLFMKMVSKPRYLANINPKNFESINFFKKNGFKLIQHTYEYIPPEFD